MKKAYTAPKLFVHGRVEEITEAFGRARASDTIFVGNNPAAPGTLFGLGGSQDGEIVPRSRP